MADSVRNCPIMHCKHLSIIEYVMYAYELRLFSLATKKFALGDYFLPPIRHKDFYQFRALHLEISDETSTESE